MVCEEAVGNICKPSTTPLSITMKPEPYTTITTPTFTSTPF